MTKNSRAKKMRHEHAEKNNLTYAEAKRVSEFPDRAEEFHLSIHPVSLRTDSKNMQTVYAVLDLLRDAFSKDRQTVITFDDETYVRRTVETLSDGTEVYLDCSEPSDGMITDIVPRAKLTDGTICEFFDEGYFWKNADGVKCGFVPSVDKDKTGLISAELCEQVDRFGNFTNCVLNEAKYEVDDNGDARVTMAFEFETGKFREGDWIEFHVPFEQ